MSQFVHVILSYPTVIFTVLMAVALLYWLFVIVGALDVDILQAGDGADAAAGEMGDGGADAGHADAGDGGDGGDADGGHDGGDGDGDGDGDGHHHGHPRGGAVEHHGEGLGGVLAALGLRNAPLTVVFSLIIFFGWVLSTLAMMFVAPRVAGTLPLWTINTLAVVLVLVVGMVLASFFSKPLGKLFIIHEAQSRAAVVGKVCTIRTGWVDDSFGQATLEDGAAGLVLQVRSAEAGKLKRGDRALIVKWDDRREAFLVVPSEEMERDA